MTHKKSSNKKIDDFSLALGGPLYQLYLRTHLAEPPLKLYKRRIIIISLFAWLPLLILSIINGAAFGSVKVPFLFDIDAHARFLGALSILVAADLVVHQQMKIIIPQFIEHGIIVGENESLFKKIIASSMQLRNSIIIELLLVILAITGGHWIWKQYMSLGVETWYAIPGINGMSLTPAGYWYIFISLPLFQFIGLRWYFRIFIWYRFLWKTARLPLRFNALHPDRAGGLSFLVNSLYAFAPILLAHSILLAGIIINRIWHEGATLSQFNLEIIALIAFLTLLATLPLMFFIAPLAKAKRAGLRDYSKTASLYVNEFRRKWIKADMKENALLGSSDIQSLADLAGSYDVAREMRLVPFTRSDILSIIFLIALPLAPLLLTVIPLEQIISRLIGVIL